MSPYTAYALIWVSTGIAVSVAIYVTKSASPLWGLFIPTLVSFIKNNEDETKY